MTRTHIVILHSMKCSLIGANIRLIFGLFAADDEALLMVEGNGGHVSCGCGGMC